MFQHILIEWHVTKVKYRQKIINLIHTQRKCKAMPSMSDTSANGGQNDKVDGFGLTYVDFRIFFFKFLYSSAHPPPQIYGQCFILHIHVFCESHSITR